MSSGAAALPATCALLGPQGEAGLLDVTLSTPCTNAQSLVPSAQDTSCLGRKGAGSQIRLWLCGLLRDRLPSPPTGRGYLRASRHRQSLAWMPAVCQRHEGRSQCVARVSVEPQGTLGTERGRRPHSPREVPAPWETGHPAPVLCPSGLTRTPCDNAAFGTSSPKDRVVTPTPAGGLPCASGPLLEAPRRTHTATRGRTGSALQMKRLRLRSQTGTRKRRRTEPRTADAPPGDSLADTWWPSPCPC